MKMEMLTTSAPAQQQDDYQTQQDGDGNQEQCNIKEPRLREHHLAQTWKTQNQLHLGVVPVICLLMHCWLYCNPFSWKSRFTLRWAFPKSSDFANQIFAWPVTLQMSCWCSASKIWKQFPHTAEAAGAEHLQTHRLTRNDCWTCCQNIFSTISTFSSHWGEKLGQNTLKHLQCNFNVDIQYCSTEGH